MRENWFSATEIKDCIIAQLMILNAAVETNRNQWEACGLLE
jgi:hypothetical protein